GTLSGLVKIELNSGNLMFYNSLNSDLPFNLINALTVDIDGNLWIGMGYSMDSRTGGLARFDGNNWNVFTTENSGLPGNLINALIADASGNIWIGTDNE